MNKKQLIESINKLPDDIEILSAKDDEGNGFNWVGDVSIGYIHKSEINDYNVEMVMSPEDLEDYKDEWGIDDDENIEDEYVKVAVIW
jgi:hypothetical protein